MVPHQGDKMLKSAGPFCTWYGIRLTAWFFLAVVRVDRGCWDRWTFDADVFRKIVVLRPKILCLPTVRIRKRARLLLTR